MKKISNSITKRYAYVKLYIDDIVNVISALEEIGTVTIDSPHYSEITKSDLSVIPTDELNNIAIDLSDGGGKRLAKVKFSTYDISVYVNTDDHLGLGIVAQIERCIAHGKSKSKWVLDSSLIVAAVNMFVYILVAVLLYVIFGNGPLNPLVAAISAIISMVLWIKISGKSKRVELVSQVRDVNGGKIWGGQLWRAICWVLMTAASSVIAVWAAKMVGG